MRFFPEKLFQAIAEVARGVGIRLIARQISRDQLHKLPFPDDSAQALDLFDPVWQALTPHEQARVLGLLIERVDYDGAQGKVAITFQPTGIQTWADELAQQHQERRA